LDIKYASLSLSDKEVALVSFLCPQVLILMVNIYLQASKKAELIFYDDFKLPELNVSYNID